MNQTADNSPPMDAPAAMEVLRPRRSYMGTVGLKLLGAWGARMGIVWVGFVGLLAIFAPLIANSNPVLLKTNDKAEGGATLTSPLYQALTTMDVVLLVGFFLALGLVFFKRGPKGKVWVWLGIVCATYIAASIFDAAGVVLRLTKTMTAADGAYQTIKETVDAPDSDIKAKLSAYQSASGDVLKWWITTSLLYAALLGGWVLSMYNLKRTRKWMAALIVGTAVVGGLLAIPAMQIRPPETTSYAKFRTMQAQGHVGWAVYTPIPYSPADTMTDLVIDQRFAAPGYHPTEAEIARDMRTKALARFGVFDDEVQTGTTIDEAYASVARYRTEYEAKRGASPALVRKTMGEIDEQAQSPQRTRLFFMGTTDKGQDLASRMIHAARIALAIGFVATGIAVTIGVFIGGLMGYFSGWVDLIGMRVVEVFSAIPVIFLLIAIVAFWGRDLVLMMSVLGLTGWVGYALFTRAEFLKLRKMDYVMAARASGTGLFQLLFRHMLPNGVTPVLVSASFGIAGMILTEATLSYIGLGLVNEPSWGQMLSNASGVGGKFYWWLAMYPIIAIFLTVFAYNMVGESMRDALDPRAHKTTS